MSSLFATLQSSNLAKRIASSVVLIPIVVGAVWSGGLAFNAMVIAALLAGLYEWIHLTAPDARPRVMTLAYTGLLATLTCGMAWGAAAGFALSLIVWLVVLLAAGRLAGADRQAHLAKALWLSAGIPILAWSGLAMMALRALPETGFLWTLYLLLVVWGTDIGGYAAGCTVKGPKIWPQISPKKTWAGLFGGMALAGVMGYIMAGQMGGIACGFVLLSMVLAVVSQAGDFFESYVKRKAGAKDSGSLIPGHGGILDRIDGLLFAAVLLGVLMALSDDLVPLLLRG